MIRHFGIFSDSSDLQAAYNNGDIINPYVALVGGELDYNLLQPEPCYIGEWSEDGEGHYTFHINDAGATAWESIVNIGQLLNVNFNGDEMDMDVLLQFDGISWSIYFVPAGGDPSDGESYLFTDGNPDTWSSNVMTDPGASASPVLVNWGGVDTLEFEANQDYPLSMSTINPECE